MIGLCTYLTGGTDYEDMRKFALERGSELGDMLSLPNGIPSTDIFKRVLDINYWKSYWNFDVVVLYMGKYMIGN